MTTMNAARQKHRRENLISNYETQPHPTLEGQTVRVCVSRKRVKNYVSFRRWARDNAADFPEPSPKLAKVLRRTS